MCINRNDVPFCTLCVFVSEHVICTLYTYAVWVMGLAN